MGGLEADSEPKTTRPDRRFARRWGPPVLPYRRCRIRDQILIELRAHYVYTNGNLVCSSQESGIADYTAVESW